MQQFANLLSGSVFDRKSIMSHDRLLDTKKLSNCQKLAEDKFLSLAAVLPILS